MFNFKLNLSTAWGVTDLLTQDANKKPILHRMYVVEYDQEIPLRALQARATKNQSAKNRHAIEYTDFKLVPLSSIQQALAEAPQGMEEDKRVYLVEYGDGECLSLHPLLAQMLTQPEVKRHLDALARHQPYQPREGSNGLTLKTPKEIARQAVRKSNLLIEFKQKSAPELKKRSEQGATREAPAALPNEGSSGTHQSVQSYRCSGIAEQTQRLRKELGIPVEAENPALKLVSAICMKRINTALEIIRKHPELDLSCLPNLDNRSAQKTINVLDLIRKYIPQRHLFNMLEKEDAEEYFQLAEKHSPYVLEQYLLYFARSQSAVFDWPFSPQFVI